MKKLLRWGGLAIAISGYVALTIWANTFPGETAISQGESATHSGMRPFWILIYSGVAMFIGSWFVPKSAQSQSVTSKDNSEASVKTPEVSESPWRKLTAEEKTRGAQYVRDQARIGNLRRGKHQDPVEENSDD